MRKRFVLFLFVATAGTATVFNLCQAQSPISFSGPPKVAVGEGLSATAVIEVTSPGAPLSSLTYAPNSNPPQFVTMSPPVFSNTATSGSASVTLHFNPLHDAAGNHTITLRATTMAGDSADFKVTVTVSDAAAIKVTRWKESVSGGWENAARWTEGVPGEFDIALIDVAGTYTVNLPATIRALGVVLNSPGATLVSATTFSCAVEIRSGSLAVIENQAITLQKPLSNRGAIRLPSRDRTSVISGLGLIENSGLIEVHPVGGSGNEAQFRLPVMITGAGRLVLSRGWANFGSASSLGVSGAVELEGDARLRVGDLPAHDMTVQRGALLTGSGTLLVGNENRMVMVGDATAAFHVAVVESARTAGVGTLSVAGGQTLTGTYDSPVRIEKDATATVVNTTFNNQVTVAAGGTLVVAENQGMTLNGRLVNQGRIAMPSRDRTSSIAGKGAIENSGVIEVYPVGGNGNEAHFRLPVTINASGTLLLSGGYANIAAGSRLSLFGTVDAQKDARLRFEPDEPARDLTVQKGAQLVGMGNLLLQGSNRIFMAADATAVLKVGLADSSRTAGPGTISFAGGQTLTGTYESPVRILMEASATVANAVFNNLLTIEERGMLVVAENQGMTVNGKLVNQGKVVLPSRDRTSIVAGTGMIDNSGLVEIYPVGGSGNEAQFKLAMLGSSNGKFLFNGGYAAVAGGGRIRTENLVEILGNSRLRVEGSTNRLNVVTNRGGLFIAPDASVQIRTRFVQEQGAGLDDQGRVCAPEIVNRGGLSGGGFLGNCPGFPQFPGISSVADQRAIGGTPLAPVAFTVSDPDTSAANLRVTAKSSNPTLIPEAGLSLSGSSATRTVTIKPVPDQTGSAVVLLTVTDPEGGFDMTGFSVFIEPSIQPNQPPVLTVPPTQLILVNTTRALNGLSVSDDDAGAADLVVTLSANNFFLFLASLDGLRLLDGQNDSSSIRFSGVLASVNSALARLALRPFRDFKGNDTLTVVVSDQGNTGIGGPFHDTKTIALSVVDSIETDSDGDGAPDVAESRAGTNPFDKGDFFGFGEPPKPASGGNFSLRFNTVPGQTYRLQHLNLDAPFGQQWVDLSQVKAGAVNTSVIDATSATASHRFYRVLLVELHEDKNVP